MSANDASDHGHSALLSDGALATLQLQHQPFSAEVLELVTQGGDPEEQSVVGPFTDDVTEEQLADVKQALITGDDLLLILGEPGAGKTTLLSQLQSNGGLRIQCFPVTGSERFSTLNLFSGILDAFKIKPPESLKEVLDELIPCLQTMVGRNVLSVITLDDAHKAGHSELTQLLSSMLYVNSQDETLLRVALSATGDFEELIPDLLPEGADLPYSSLTIEGFTPQRAAAYLDYRLQLAGYDQQFPFTERDMASLVDHSAGRPAELHVLTADVLNEQYGQSDHSITSDLMTKEGGGFLQSRVSKLILGAVATVLILFGVLMFLPSQQLTEPTVQREPLAVAPQATKPAVVVPKPVPLPTPVVPEPPPLPPTDLTQNTAAQSGIAQNADAIGSAATAITDALPTIPEPVVPEPVDRVPANTTTEITTSVSPSADTAQTITAGQSNGADNVSASQNRQEDTPATVSERLQSAALESAPENASATNTADANDETPADQNATDAIATEADAQTRTAEADVASIETAPTVSGIGDDPELAGLLESPSWILVQDESLFTIQMSASTDLPSVRNFLRTNPLPSPNSIFSFEREGEIWYALVHGIFTSVGEAQNAVELMSASAQRDQPWIRSIARVKSILLQ